LTVHLALYTTKLQSLDNRRDDQEGMSVPLGTTIPSTGR